MIVLSCQGWGSSSYRHRQLGFLNGSSDPSLQTFFSLGLSDVTLLGLPTPPQQPLLPRLPLKCRCAEGSLLGAPSLRSAVTPLRAISFMSQL